MTSYNTYPNLPSATLEAPPQVGFHLNVVRAKRQGLIAKEQTFKQICHRLAFPGHNITTTINCLKIRKEKEWSKRKVPQILIFPNQMLA